MQLNCIYTENKMIFICLCYYIDNLYVFIECLKNINHSLQIIYFYAIFI